MQQPPFSGVGARMFELFGTVLDVSSNILPVAPPPLLAQHMHGRARQELVALGLIPDADDV